MYRLKVYTTLDLVHNLLELPQLCMAQKPLAPCDDDVLVDVVAGLPDLADGDPPLEEQLDAGVSEFTSLKM